MVFTLVPLLPFAKPSTFKKLASINFSDGPCPGAGNKNFSMSQWKGGKKKAVPKAKSPMTEATAAKKLGKL
jgi:hypothetical protein